MRTVEYRATHVPAFLTKLWKLVTDPNSDELISWSIGGTSFIIYDEIRFAKDLLPMYFKHNNMASFVRQLNMYGFRKLSCIDQGGMHSIKHEVEFYHQYFIKDQENLLELIKRKIPTNRSSDDSKIKPEYVKELISSIKSLQGKQRTSEEGMKNLRRENKLLWRQLALMNNRYIKQQAVLQQVLPVFMNMVQSSQRLPLKRRLALMINDAENEAKSPRIETPSYYVEHEPDLSPSLTPSPGNVSNRGPVITEMESSKIFAENILCSPNASSKDNEVTVDSPISSLSDHTNDSPFPDPETMESPLGVMNCNFKSMNQMATNVMPSVEVSTARLMSPPGCIVTQPGLAQQRPLVTSPTLTTASDRIITSPGLLPQNVTLGVMENQMGEVQSTSRLLSPPGMMVADGSNLSPSMRNHMANMNPMLSPVSSLPVNECSSTAAASSVNMPSCNSFIPTVSATAEVCQNKTVPIMNIMNEASNHGVTVAPVMPAQSATLSSQEQAIENILNWLPNNGCENEQNIDNWLGQLIKADNLAVGASLPTRVLNVQTQ